VLGEEVGAVLAGIHREKGVELLPDDGVSAFTGDGRVEQVTTSKGAQLGCDFAVVGAGIEPAVDILSGTPVAVDNGVVVDEMCRASVGDVYAAGDVANHLHPILGRLRVEHYNNAERHGRAAARSMLGKGEPYADIHSFWSDQYEHSIEYIGYARRWDELVMRGSLEERAFVGFYIEGGRVRAAVGLNRGGDPEADEEGELAAARILIREAAAVDKAQLADDRVDLHTLAGNTARG
jgi:3-phenylpropionate/trans-cinnamate dioxygenase ferredoxin reductase subunit